MSKGKGNNDQRGDKGASKPTPPAPPALLPSKRPGKVSGKRRSNYPPRTARG